MRRIKQCGGRREDNWDNKKRTNNMLNNKGVYEQ